MKKIKLYSLICIFHFAVILSGQSINIDCNIKFNTLDSLLSIKDTIGVIKLYETLDYCDSYKTKYLNLHMAKIYGFKNKTIKVQNEIIKAIDKGYVVSANTLRSLHKRYNKIEKLAGEDFLLKMIARDRHLLTNLDSSTLVIRKRILNVHNEDQNLRKEKIYRKCRSHDYNFKTKYGSVDTLPEHEEMMNCANEYRTKDSLIVLDFVNLIDSLGYVPSANSLKFDDISTLICHTSHYEFEADLENIYFSSVLKGTISPKVYAWYLGYNKDYYLKERVYYYDYTKTMLDEAKLTKIKTDEINRLRRKIGLPSLPTAIWSENGLR